MACLSKLSKKRGKPNGQRRSSKRVQSKGRYSQLILIQPFPKLLGHSTQIPNRDLPCVVVVEEFEGASDLVSWVSGEEVGGHWEEREEESVVSWQTASISGRRLGVGVEGRRGRKRRTGGGKGGCSRGRAHSFSPSSPSLVLPRAQTDLPATFRA